MSWRTDLQEKVKGLAGTLESLRCNHADLERRFREHVQSQSRRPQIKIEHNPINNMYQWEIWPPPSNPAEKPFSEGRADSYQAAMDAVIYHEARLRLGLPNKPNGVTKNY